MIALGTTLVILVLAFLLAASISPFETLGWWAGWYGDRDDEQSLEDAFKQGGAEILVEPSQKSHFVVFLTGVHSVSGNTYAGREINLLSHLEKHLDDCEIFEVFPYAVTNRALTGERVFGAFWRWAYNRKRRGQWILGTIINMRNIFQVGIAADKRYGPMYNQGSAEMILRGLRENGYQSGSGVPVTLIGYSGGGSIASGAAPFVKSQIQAPVVVISLGGAIFSHDGLLRIDKLYHLIGNDFLHKFTNIVFPMRWKIFAYSAWNRAMRRGLIVLYDLGPATHTGKGGYLDSKSFLDDGRSYFQQTVDALVTIIGVSSQSEID